MVAVIVEKMLVRNATVRHDVWLCDLTNPAAHAIVQHGGHHGPTHRRTRTVVEVQRRGTILITTA